jgi:hypothetical protein
MDANRKFSIILLFALIFVGQYVRADISTDCLGCGAVIYKCSQAGTDPAKVIACIYGIGSKCKKCGDDLCKGTQYKDTLCSVKGLSGDKLCDIYCKCHAKKDGSCHGRGGKECQCMNLP